MLEAGLRDRPQGRARRTRGCVESRLSARDFDGLSVQTLGDPAVAVEATTWSRVKPLMR